ncbi:MAG: hypothetical protein ACD_28C00179G0003 [uncultured bacterium]|nr:MAG: hypothetical protein ACD_28C00179G0003 [uncultured bacterium]
MLRLILIDEAQMPLALKRADFIRLIRKTEALVPPISEKEVEFVLMGDERMREINSASRGLDKPTDVLSFANREIQDPTLKDPHSLGQIFISVPAAQRNADEMRQSLEEEVRFLFVHGLLHILGYDHQTLKEEKVMMTIAYEVLGRPAYC